MFFWSCPETTFLPVVSEPPIEENKHIKAPSTHVSFLKGLGACGSHAAFIDFSVFFSSGFFIFHIFLVLSIFSLLILVCFSSSSSFLLLPFTFSFLLPSSSYYSSYFQFSSFFPFFSLSFFVLLFFMFSFFLFFFLLLLLP